MNHNCLRLHDEEKLSSTGSLILLICLSTQFSKFNKEICRIFLMPLRKLLRYCSKLISFLGQFYSMFLISPQYELNHQYQASTLNPNKLFSRFKKFYQAINHKFLKERESVLSKRKQSCNH
ncbi:CLUMA_CG002712, isoform A [Clunio marinus]|uniref:CLUMA_CG002712, isoform A n=1 Tax=Clunio marinus TaxID=568069 RepID=A0A1J1HR06_9DIPT|nr:CLUMA_CG002712, isoform A [Clunio marinus]